MSITGGFECHGHMLLDGADFAAARARHSDGPDDAALRAQLAALRAAGVRWYRDGGDPLGVSLRARELAPEYGICALSPVFAIYRRGRYGSILGRGYETMEEYRALVDEVLGRNGDFIKLVFSGILMFRTYGELSCPGLPAEEISRLVDYAHSVGLAVMAHVNGADTVRAAIAAGTDSIEHGYFMDEDCLRLLATSDCIWVPTLTAVEAFLKRPELADPAIVRQTLERQSANVRRAAEQGVLIACGSDSGAAGVPHGAGALREAALLEQSGLSPARLEAGNHALRQRFCRRKETTE